MQCSRDVAWCSIEVLRNTEASMRYHAQPHWRNLFSATCRIPRFILIYLLHGIPYCAITHWQLLHR